MKHFESPTEKELVVSLKGNSQDALKQLFDRYSQKLFYFSRSYLKSDVESEEIVQEVFIKIWEIRGNLKSDKSFKSYLFTIAFNAIKKHFNKKIREEKHKHELFQWLIQSSPDLESRNDFEKLLEKLDYLIDQFPPRRKKIFLSRKKEGKSINEIAAEMAISPKTVKNQITAGMNSLREAFCEEDFSSLLFYFLFIS